MPNPGSFTTPPTAVTGGTVTINYTNVFRDNSNWFDALCPAPPSANKVLFSTSGTTGAWGTVTADRVQDAAITQAIVGAGAATAEKVAALNVTEVKLSSAALQALAVTKMVAWVRQVSEIPSGWTRETDLAGRLAVGAGTVFGTTWATETNYGGSWAHRHALTGTSSTSTASTTAKNGDNDWPAGGPVSHSHTLSGSTDFTTWLFPMRGAVFVRKS